MWSVVIPVALIALCIVLLVIFLLRHLNNQFLSSWADVKGTIIVMSLSIVYLMFG